MSVMGADASGRRIMEAMSFPPPRPMSFPPPRPMSFPMLDRAGRLREVLVRDGATCIWCGRAFDGLVAPHHRARRAAGEGRSVPAGERSGGVRPVQRTARPPRPRRMAGGVPRAGVAPRRGPPAPVSHPARRRDRPGGRPAQGAPLPRFAAATAAPAERRPGPRTCLRVASRHAADRADRGDLDLSGAVPGRIVRRPRRAGPGRAGWATARSPSSGTTAVPSAARTPRRCAR